MSESLSTDEMLEDIKDKVILLKAQLARAIEALRPFAELAHEDDFLEEYRRAAEVYKELTASYAAKID